MSSLAELSELMGFFSYSRQDDLAFGDLSKLRHRIEAELSAQLGRNNRNFRLFQDKETIATGQLWEEQIKAAIDLSAFFIPIVTPRAMNSEYCKIEFNSFLEREAALHRKDLVFPIYYIWVAALDDEDQWRNDPVLRVIGARHYADWRDSRQLDINSVEVKKEVERFCRTIVKALRAPQATPIQPKKESSPIPPMPTKSPEEEEAETKRREEEARANRQKVEEEGRLEKERDERRKKDEREAREQKEREQRAAEERARRDKEERDKKDAENAQRARQEKEVRERAAREAEVNRNRNQAGAYGKEMSADATGVFIGMDSGTARRTISGLLVLQAIIRIIVTIYLWTKLWPNLTAPAIASGIVGGWLALAIAGIAVAIGIMQWRKGARITGLLVSLIAIANDAFILVGTSLVISGKPPSDILNVILVLRSASVFYVAANVLTVIYLWRFYARHRSAAPLSL
jgi:hypothetical protein